MPTQSSGSYELAIIPFAPVPVRVRDNADQLDQAAQSILQLFDSAASVAEEDSRRTPNMTEKLLHHLHAARPPSWRGRPQPISKELSGRNSGFTESTQRLKIGFCDRATSVAA